MHDVDDPPVGQLECELPINVKNEINAQTTERVILLECEVILSESLRLLIVSAITVKPKLITSTLIKNIYEVFQFFHKK
jgi:hypothetical protein